MNLKRIVYIFLIGLEVSSCAVLKKGAPERAAGGDSEVAAAKQTETQLTEDEQNELEYLFIEGVKQKKLGNLKDAASVFSRCLEIDPNSAAAMYELAQVHYANKDLTSASLLLQKAVSIDGTNKWYKILLAQVYQQRKQYVEAADVYDQLYQAEPDDNEYLFTKAGLLAMAKEYEQAINAYNELQKKTGIIDQVSVAKEQVYMSWGKTDEAFEEIRKLIAVNPENPQYYGILAEMYQNQGDQENALKYYNKILEIQPDNGFVHFSLAGFYQQEGDYGRAFEHIKKAFENDELDANTKIQYYMMQTANPDSSDWTDNQISELLQILHDKYPDNNLMYTIYADNLIRQNKLKEAREYLKKYVATDETNFAIWQQLLFISNDLQDFKTLYTDSKAALPLFPEEAVVYALNAVAAIQLDKYEEALKVLDKGEPYAGDNQNLKIQFEIYKAEANYKLKHVEEAFKAYEEVIRLDPTNYMAMNNYAYYLSMRGEDLNKAESMSSKVVRANPLNPTYLDTHAWVLFKKKDYSGAKHFMETALENGGDKNAVLVEHYGDILYMMGNKVKALENWKKAKELGEGSDVLDQKIKESRYIESKQP